MVLFPNCKINLGLRVTGKRPDGFHDLETIFYPLPLFDALEIITGHSVNEDIEFNATGIDIPGEGNLCQKAWQLIKNDFPGIPPVNILLHKAIPIGAGLGGGSSDGAFTLIGLNKKLKLGLSDTQLINYALQLGSDCPFFIFNKPCIATGRGELMQEINVDLNDHYFVLADPGLHISTAWAFSNVHPGAPSAPLSSVIAKPVSEWKNTLINDFEEPVLRKYPELEALKDELYNAGATYVSLTGTGSCVYGLFNKKIVQPNINTSFKLYHLTAGR